jgi:hypothetical protein
MPLKYKACLTDTKDDFTELCNTRITCHVVSPSWSPHLRQGDSHLHANPEKKGYNNVIKWIHWKLTFIFKQMNVTNWNCYVISVILLKYDIDVTVQHNRNLHVLYSEMTRIKSATMYEFGLFGLIISHCKVWHCCILLCVLQKYKSNSTLHKLVTYNFLNKCLSWFCNAGVRSNLKEQCALQTSVYKPRMNITISTHKHNITYYDSHNLVSTYKNVNHQIFHVITPSSFLY